MCVFVSRALCHVLNALIPPAQIGGSCRASPQHASTRPFVNPPIKPAIILPKNKPANQPTKQPANRRRRRQRPTDRFACGCMDTCLFF